MRLFGLFAPPVKGPLEDSSLSSASAAPSPARSYRTFFLNAGVTDCGSGGGFVRTTTLPCVRAQKKKKKAGSNQGALRTIERARLDPHSVGATSDAVNSQASDMDS